MARSGTPTRGMISLPRRRRSFALQPATRTSATPGLARIGDFKPTRRAAAGGWQDDAFTYYESLPPIGYVMDFKASTVAACDFVVMVDTPDGRIPSEGDERIDRLMASLVGPRGGIEELRRRAALLLEISGEAYFVGSPVEDEAEAVWWEFLSVEEILPPDGISGGKYRRDYGGGQKEELPDDTYIARMWRSDARYSNLPACGLRRCLDTCRELVLLSRMTEAIIASRLPMGLLLIPDTVDWNPTTARTDETAGSDVDVAEEPDFLDDLIAHLSAPITDFGSASTLVPLVVRANKEDLEAIKVVDLARGLDQYAAGLRDEMYGRLAIGLDVPPEILDGKGGVNHWCVDETTEVLTKDRGWVAHDQLSTGDVILTLNHETGLSEWQPAITVARFDVEGLEMVSIEGLTHSSLTTTNHRWPTMHRRLRNVVVDGRHTTEKAGIERIWTTSEKLNTNDTLITAAPSADVPTEAKWSDAFVEAVAWFWTEGTCAQREGRTAPTVAITQSHEVNNANVARIRRALTTLYGPPTDGPMSKGGRGQAAIDPIPRWREVPRPNRGITDFKLNAAAAAPIVAVAPSRVVAKQFISELTAVQLDLFIDVSTWADGTEIASGTRYLGQKAIERVEPLELALVLSGRSTYTYDVASKPDGPDGRDRLMHWVSYSDRTGYGIHKRNVARQEYTGTVWCPKTANGSWFARRNGKTYFTGNTGWNIDNDFLFKHVQPLGKLVADFLTYAYLRPMLVESEGLSVEDAADYTITFDPSPLANNQDDDSKARDLWSEGLISDRAVVEKQGWDPDAVMPDDDERARRLFERLVLAKVVTPSDEGLTMLGLDPTWFKEAPVPSPFGQFPPGEQDPPVDGVDPQQPGVPDEPTAEDAKPKTGDAQPAQRQAARAGLEERVLVMQLATRADADYDRALEKAGARIVGPAQHVPAWRGRFSSTRHGDIPSLVTPDDLRVFKVSAPLLLEGAWDGFSRVAREWIHNYLVDGGHPSGHADHVAGQATARLVERLTRWGLANFHGARVRSRSTGLRVPVDLMAEVVAEAQAARTLVAVG